MQLFSAHLTSALSAAGNYSRLATATVTTKRTAWYPAFSEKASWSYIG